jgi:hypothetical protein
MEASTVTKPVYVKEEPVETNTDVKYKQRISLVRAMNPIYNI